MEVIKRDVMVLQQDVVIELDMVYGNYNWVDDDFDDGNLIGGNNKINGSGNHYFAIFIFIILFMLLVLKLDIIYV